MQGDTIGTLRNELAEAAIHQSIRDARVIELKAQLAEAWEENERLVVNIGEVRLVIEQQDRNLDKLGAERDGTIEDKQKQQEYIGELIDSRFQESEKRRQAQAREQKLQEALARGRRWVVRHADVVAYDAALEGE